MSVSLTKAAMRVIIGGLGLYAGIAMAFAQDAAVPQSPPAAQAAPGSPEATPPPSEDVKQIKLTEDQVTHFIAAQGDLAAIASKIQSAGD